MLMTAAEVKAIRQKMKLTQRALAALVNVTNRTVRRWETGGVRSKYGEMALLDLEERFDTGERL